MSSYGLALFVHVLSAVLLLGGSLLVTPAINLQIRRAGDTIELRKWLNAARPMRWIDPASSLAILASGVYLASIGHWWTARWLWVALAAWVLNSTLAMAVVRPKAEEVARVAFDSDTDRLSPRVETLRGSTSWWLAADSMLATDVGILFLMVTQPDLLASLAVVLASNVLVLGSRVFGMRVRLGRRVVTDAQ